VPEYILCVVSTHCLAQRCKSNEEFFSQWSIIRYFYILLLNVDTIRFQPHWMFSTDILTSNRLAAGWFGRRSK